MTGCGGRTQRPFFYRLIQVFLPAENGSFNLQGSWVKNDSIIRGNDDLNHSSFEGRSGSIGSPDVQEISGEGR